MTSLRRYLLCFLMLLAVVAESSAQGSAGKESFPVTYGPTNVGRDFWLSFPANWDYAASFKYVRLYITSGVRTRVKVWTGPSLLTTVFTKPNDIITVDLPLLGAQPFTRDDRAPVPDDQVYPNKAVHVESEDPIVVYGINRITYTSDGLLAIPTQGLGREYIVASAPDIADGGIQRLPSQYVITAPYDNTTVTIINTFDTPNNKAGRAVTVTMQKGDVYSAMSSGPLGDLTGTRIFANNPVAVTTGQNCTYLPRAEFPACDHLCEMMLPTSAWGKVYHLVPFANRLRGDYIRVFAGEPKAKIFLNGQQIATLNNAGGYEGEAWLQLLPPQRELMEFTSDKRIYVAQYNNSQTYDGVQTDPFFLGLTPVEQYQTGLTFTTPSNDYPQNFINLVLDSAGWNDIEIAAGGTEDWRKLSTVAGSVPKSYPTLINGVRYQGFHFEIKPGTYRMRGKKPFAGYIYGWSSFDSYGYPLSVAVGNLSKPDTVAPLISFTQDCDGNVEVTTTDLPTDASIRSNLSTIELDPTSVNYEIVDPLTVRRKLEPAGNVETTTFKMRVLDKSIDAMAIIIISDGRGNTTRDTVYYSAFGGVFDPEFADFGQMNIGAKVTRTGTLKNLSSRNLTIKEIILQKGNVGFKVIDPVAEFVLGPAGSGTDTKVVTVEFTATASGRFQDIIGVRDECGPHMLDTLNARVGNPVIEVSDENFGQWPVSSPQAKEGTFTISNRSTDGGELIVYGVAGGPTDGIVFKTPDGYPVSFPMTIAPGEPVTVRVTFKPTAATPYTDAILFTHNAGPSVPPNDSVAVLTGEGTNATLVATSKDWGRRRVGTGPYIDTVKVYNYGNQDVRILDATPVRNSDFVLIDRAKVQNLILKGNDSVALAVSFTPTAVGDRQMVIVYDHDLGDVDVSSVLTGIGTVPSLITENLDFGTMAVGGPELELETRFWAEGEFFDNVTVTGFALTGDPDFRYELPAGVTLPFTINGVNDTLRVRSFFQAQANGPRSAQLTAITAPTDNVDATSNWIGAGASGAPAMALSATSPDNVCDSAVLTVTVRNNGNENLTITDYRIAGTGGGTFRLIQPAAPFLLTPGQERQIQVMFIANPAGGPTQIDDLVFTSNDPNDANEKITLTGNRQTALTARSSTDLGTDAITGKAVFGKDIVATVSLDESVAARNVTSYRAIFRYEASQLVPRTNQVKLLGANPTGSTFTVDASQAQFGIVAVDVVTSGPLTATGELVSMPFGVTWDQAMARTITSEITTTAGCVAVASSNASIDVEPICGFSVRLIELSTTKYALDQNSPNPFNPTTKIGYSLGLDGPTKIELFDAAGTLVQTLLDAHQQPGAYEITLDVNNLASGLYYYRITSGDWTETRQMIVKK